VYLADYSRFRRPKIIFVVPDTPTLDLLMRETCWTETHSTLVLATGLFIVTLIQLADAHLAWLLVLTPLAFLYWIGQRGKSTALARCARLPTKNSSLILTRDSGIAGLEAVAFIRVCAGVAILAAFAATTIIGMSISPELNERLKGPLTAIFVMIAMGASSIIAAGGHVLNSDHLDLATKEKA
jgi:hypothetical protein